MSYIRWSTKLPNRRYSHAYAWGDVDGDVVISLTEKATKKRGRQGTGGNDIRLTHAEMRHMCESYLRQEKSRRTPY